ncbi:MAG: hypothetical protein ACYSWU_00105 [Planctomycetota bacterium]|jgi:hypothetical protein
MKLSKKTKIGLGLAGLALGYYFLVHKKKAAAKLPAPAAGKQAPSGLGSLSSDGLGTLGGGSLGSLSSCGYGSLC